MDPKHSFYLPLLCPESGFPIPMSVGNPVRETKPRVTPTKTKAEAPSLVSSIGKAKAICLPNSALGRRKDGKLVQGKLLD